MLHIFIMEIRKMNKRINTGDHSFLVTVQNYYSTFLFLGSFELTVMHLASTCDYQVVSFVIILRQSRHLTISQIHSLKVKLYVHKHCKYQGMEIVYSMESNTSKGYLWNRVIHHVHNI